MNNDIMNPTIAIGAGYEFTLVKIRDIGGINMRESRTVKVDDKEYQLYIGSTYEDSKKIDGILDNAEKVYRIK